MNKAKVRATFIPNGTGAGSTLRYSIFISIDYSSLGNEPSIAQACAYPDFIATTKFTLMNSGAPIKGQQGKSFFCPEAINLWNFIFNSDLMKPPQLYFKEDIRSFQTDYPLEFIPEPAKIIDHFQSHYSYRLLNKLLNNRSEKKAFEHVLSKLQLNIDSRPPEIDDVKTLIRYINQDPAHHDNTYAIRLQNAQKIHVSEIISFFSNYPTLLRRLGLLFSYEIDSSLVPDGAEINVQLDPSAALQSIYEPEKPEVATVVEKKNNFFMAKPKPSKEDTYRNGLLNLQQKVSGKPRFCVTQTTAVEAAFKADAYLNKADKGNLPTITTNGIYIIDNYRKQEKDELDGSLKPKLFLEDILTGFRFDMKIVNPKPGKAVSWKSLSAKSSKYEFAIDNEQLFEAEEGWTNTDTKVTSQNKDGKNVEVVADILCHISGWGLNTENPLQKAAQTVKTKKNDEVIRTNKNQGTGDPVHDFLKDKIKITSRSIQSSFHPLRTGSTYQMRARLVCLDGYSISINEADSFTKNDENKNPVLRTNDFMFRRLESVGAPVFVLKHALYEGDVCGQNKKVIESKRGESEYTLVIRSKSNDCKTSEITERGLAPASTSWHLAEWQSAFDSATEYANADKLKRSIHFLPKIVENNGRKYWKERTGKFKANGDTNSKVPYIVDPLGQCFEIFCDENETYSLPFTSNSDLHFWKDSFDWWNIKTWNIVVREQRRRQSPGTIRGKNCIFSVDSWNRTVTILVAKGEDLKFKIRNFPMAISDFYKHHFIPTLVYQLLNEKADKSPEYLLAKDNIFTNQAKNETVQIRDNFLFAEREFRVVHAVKKPLFAPTFVNSPMIKRSWVPGDVSAALFTSTIHFPGKTSNKLDLFASWKDIGNGEKEPLNYENVYVDALLLNGYLEKDKNVTPEGSDIWLLGTIIDGGVETSVPLSPLPGVTLPAPPSGLKVKMIYDEKKKLLKFRGAMSLDDRSTLINKSSHAQYRSAIEEHFAKSNKEPSYIDVEKDFYARHDFGDTKHRIVEYTLKATSRFTEFFPAVSGQQDPADEYTASSKPVIVNIPSSQAPSTPNVAFIIPFFEWETETDGHFRSTRKGNRLRVYLEKPWFSSGENEKLAVIISSTPSYQVEKEGVISKWGRDVTTRGRNLSPLTPDNFKNSIGLAKNVTINDPRFKQRAYDKGAITNKIDRIFTAPIFDVKPDRDENGSINFWYSDIEFDDVNAYFPFVQLSVARYQKDSIPDEELSSAILCQFTQIAPTRSVSVSKSGNYLDINVFGSSYKADENSVKSEVHIRFLPKDSMVTDGSEIIYSLNDYDDANTSDSSWHLLTNSIVLKNGIVWRYKGIPRKRDGTILHDYLILIKEFETFSNQSHHKDPDKDPALRLTYGDVLDL